MPEPSAHLLDELLGLGPPFIGAEIHAVRREEAHPSLRVLVIPAEKFAVVVPAAAVDDVVDDRVQCQVGGRITGLVFAGVVEQDVQKLVHYQGLDLGLLLAVEADELEVHQQPGPFLVEGNRQGRHGIGELDACHREDPVAGEGALLDEVLQDRLEVIAVDVH